MLELTPRKRLGILALRGEGAHIVRRQALRAAAIIVPMVAAAILSGQSKAQAPTAASLVAEVRRAFTLGGRRIPPEIFRDFGDGNLADSLPIWVTVDLRAAIDSNLYFDEIKQTGNWVSQRKQAPATMNGAEETAYTFVGAAENGLLVVLASYSGGGSGDFFTLHLLSVDAARAFGPDGDVYDRIDLTNLRSAPLGDRWQGEVHIEGNTIRIVTTRKGPADQSGSRDEKTIEARRP
jgi:hypothetical protein